MAASGNINNDVISGSGFGVTGFLNAGYRYQPINKGLMFNVK